MPSAAPTKPDLNGIICLKKPKFFSSFDLVEMVRRHLNFKKVGHAGTLDPRAEGLLILLTGRATKMTTFFMDDEKEYLAEIILGAETLSGDGDSELSNSQFKNITRSQVLKALAGFQGEISQSPPHFSAVHFEGQRLYQLAREGFLPEVPARKVFVRRIKLEKFQKRGQFYFLRCRISCGKGFYIRSLAADLGRKLETGAYLSRLIRTKIGNFSVQKALALSEFMALSKKRKFEKIFKSFQNKSWPAEFKEMLKNENR